MADVEAAIAAAMGAAMPSAPPLSPVIKAEPPSSDAMVIDCEPAIPPPQSPRSPLKRSRSPADSNPVNGDDAPSEKRMKTEPAPKNDMDEIARMVQAVQASVMKDFLPTPAPNIDHQPGAEAEAEARVVADPDPKPTLESDSNAKPITANTATSTSTSIPTSTPAPQLTSELGLGLEHKPRSPPHPSRSDEVLETTEHGQVNITSDEAAISDHHRSPSGELETRLDTLWSNPRDYTRRKHFIPGLGALALDILVALSEQTLEDTVATLTSDSDSDIAREYSVLRRAFDVQRRQLFYPKEAPRILDAPKLGIKDQTREVIRIANLASTCASIFGANDITLEEVDKNFLRIFVPEGRALSHDAAELYLGLKTQLFLAVLEGDLNKPKDRFLEELFVTDVERSLQAHHPCLSLTISERDFVANSKARKAMLLVASAPADSIFGLTKQFTYEAFLDTLSTYLNDHIDNIHAQVSGKVETKLCTESPTPADSHTQDLAAEFDLGAMIAEASRAAAQGACQPTSDESLAFDDLSAFLSENVSRAVEQSRQDSHNVELPSAIASAAESASRATALALESIARTQYRPTPLPHSSGQIPTSTDTQTYQAQQTQPSQYFSYQQQAQQQALSSIQTNFQPQSDRLPPNQTDSTPALYERARQAAAARSSTHARREGSHSTRRPWSPDEEKALMMGLDLVKGPHWSQILSLFGPNGSMSQILADRTQVQLKDKARNLKLFFLKTNSEMPYYLQCVTGELKTRAPTQAARKEAEEKARMNSEEHQAHMNGILTLAGGLQNNAPPRSSPSRAIPNNTTPHQQQLPRPTSHHSSNTPSISRQLPQPKAAAQLPRPVIPAPQPVSLPTLTPTSQQQHTQQPPSQLATQRSENPSAAAAAHPPPKLEVPTTQPHLPQPQPQPQQQQVAPAPATAAPPDHSNLSIEDQALLSLKAAMEGMDGMGATSPASATHTEMHVKQEDPSG
ncbi:hypothetical protein F4808DRAFT_50489 [Astrocystis sublimbata]|nr:hypothetical protein F4808DRAFT_50489 [Astrocystis sublimbata]